MAVAESNEQMSELGVSPHQPVLNPCQFVMLFSLRRPAKAAWPLLSPPVIDSLLISRRDTFEMVSEIGTILHEEEFD